MYIFALFLLYTIRILNPNSASDYRWTTPRRSAFLSSTMAMATAAALGGGAGAAGAGAGAGAAAARNPLAMLRGAQPHDQEEETITGEGDETTAGARCPDSAVCSAGRPSAGCRSAEASPPLAASPGQLGVGTTQRASGRDPSRPATSHRPDLASLPPCPPSRRSPFITFTLAAAEAKQNLAGPPPLYPPHDNVRLRGVGPCPPAQGPAASPPLGSAWGSPSYISLAEPLRLSRCLPTLPPSHPLTLSIFSLAAPDALQLPALPELSASDEALLARRRQLANVSSLHACTLTRPHDPFLLCTSLLRFSLHCFRTAEWRTVLASERHRNALAASPTLLPFVPAR